MKKALAIILSLVMVVSLLPIAVVADAAEGSSYYLTGTIAGWGLDEDLMFTRTDNIDHEEYVITVNLTADDAFKAVKTNKTGSDIVDWYPDGMENNLAVGIDGLYEIYFRPNGDGDENWIYCPYTYESAIGGAINHGGNMFYVSLIEEEEPEELGEAVINYDGDTYYAHVGDTVELATYLDLSMCDITSADSLEFRINYDKSKLRLISDWRAVDGSSDAFPSCNDRTNLFSNDSVEDGTYFFATASKPWDFSERKLFINLQFEVIDAGESEMSSGFWNFGCVDSDGFRFVNDGEFVADFGFTHGIWVDCPHGIEPIEPIDVPTEAPTETPAIEPTEPAAVPTEPAVEPTEAPTTYCEPEDDVPNDVDYSNYFLIGTFNEWQPASGYRFMSTSAEDAEEYVVRDVHLNHDDKFKAMLSDGISDNEWYPDGWDNDITVDQVDGTYDVYFRPNGDGREEDGWIYIRADEWYNGCTRGGCMFRLELTEPDVYEIWACTDQRGYRVRQDWAYTYEFYLDLRGDLTSIDASVSFDTRGIEVTGVSFPELGEDVTYNIDNEEGRVYFNYADTKGVDLAAPDRILVSVDFVMNAEWGWYGFRTEICDLSRGDDIMVNDYDVWNWDFNTYDTIRVAGNPLGDVDGDGEVTILDATRIQRRLANLCMLDGSDYDRDINEWDDPLYQVADVDGDGRVSIFDALRIRRYLAGICELDGSVNFIG